MLNLMNLVQDIVFWITPNSHNLVDLQSYQEAPIGIIFLIYYLKDEFEDYGEISSHE